MVISNIHSLHRICPKLHSIIKILLRLLYALLNITSVTFSRPDYIWLKKYNETFIVNFDCVVLINRIYWPLYMKTFYKFLNLLFCIINDNFYNFDVKNFQFKNCNFRFFCTQNHQRIPGNSALTSNLRTTTFRVVFTVLLIHSMINNWIK